MDRNSKEFKELQREWYKKLKDTGFEEIEQEDGNLKLWACHAFKTHYNPTSAGAKEEYYRLAGHFLYQYTFESEQERLTWELHSQGKSIREILIVIAEKGYKSHKNKVHQTIKRLAKVMVQTCL